MYGISEHLAQSLLLDASRRKYEAAVANFASLRNACLVLADSRRDPTSVQHQFVSMERREVMLHGYLPGSRSFALLTFIRRSRLPDRQNLPRRCRRHELGVALPFAAGVFESDARSRSGVTSFSNSRGAHTRSERELTLLASLSHAVSAWERNRELIYRRQRSH